MADYRLNLDDDLRWQLKAIGKDVRRLKRGSDALVEEGQHMSDVALSDYPNLLAGLRQARAALDRWCNDLQEQQYVVRLLADTGERRRWTAWEAEVLHATGLAKTQCDAWTADCVAGLKTLSSVVDADSLSDFAEALGQALSQHRGPSQGPPSGGMDNMYLVTLAWGAEGRPEKHYAERSAPDGTYTLGGVVAQACNGAAAMRADLADESVASALASLAWLSPACLRVLRDGVLRRRSAAQVLGECLAGAVVIDWAAITHG